MTIDVSAAYLLFLAAYREYTGEGYFDALGDIEREAKQGELIDYLVEHNYFVFNEEG